MRERLTTGSGFLSSPIPDESMLRTPSAIEGEGGAISEDDARAKGRMVQVRDQMAQLAFENGLKVTDGVAGSLLPTLRASDGYERRNQKTMNRIATEGGDMTMPTLARTVLLPTPQTMDGLPARSPEKIAESKERTPAGYSNLRESVVNDLLPTVVVTDAKGTRNSTANRRDGSKHNSGSTLTDVLLPTPMTSEGRQTNSPGGWNRNTPPLGTMVHSILLPTPDAYAGERGGSQNPDKRKAGGHTVSLADQTEKGTDWGKFAPAIERWEQVIGREAPSPTKPDGKDGAHRLSSKLTEWMMGLPDGWITSVGLSRNEELKACGNGVVPQQAALALSMLLGKPIETEREREVMKLPTPTVSDTFTSNLASSQQKDGSMHSVTLPQIVERIHGEK